MTKIIVKVDKLPVCDFCDSEATYDGKTIFKSAWANMCEPHFKEYGVGLGLGKGQELSVSPSHKPWAWEKY